MRPQLQLNPRKDGALIREIERLAGEKRPPKQRGKATLGLTGKRILMLTPANRVRLEAFVSALLAEQEE